MATVPGKNPGILLELFAVVQASERKGVVDIVGEGEREGVREGWGVGCRGAKHQ